MPAASVAPVDAKPVMAAAAEITPEKYPDSDAVTVDQKSVRVYRADGTGECQDETFTKVLTEKGKRDNRTLTMNFMLPYTTVAVPDAGGDQTRRHGRSGGRGGEFQGVH